MCARTVQSITSIPHSRARVRFGLCAGAACGVPGGCVCGASCGCSCVCGIGASGGSGGGGGGGGGVSERCDDARDGTHGEVMHTRANSHNFRIRQNLRLERSWEVGQGTQPLSTSTLDQVGCPIVGIAKLAAYLRWVATKMARRGVGEPSSYLTLCTVGDCCSRKRV